MKKEQAYRFRDPIHGYIEMSGLERELVDTPSFQRLRRIRQLATTNMVYHGAEHTRFGHSLGVMHLTSRVFDSIVQKNPTLFDIARREYYRQILRLVGLTHDLGHAPFSHASEELFDSGLVHEDYTKKILFESEVKDKIDDIGRSFQEEYGDDYPITSEIIWRAYIGLEKTGIADLAKDSNGTPIDPLHLRFLKSIMDSELDCDKMDYLLRDSYYCGVQYGHYDLNRLVDSFTVYRDDQNSPLRLAVEADGVQAVEEFILARYFMFVQVYFHKTRRLLDKRLISCMKKVLPGGRFPTDCVGYLEWDDGRVLQEAFNSNCAETEAFLNRETMSCVFSSEAHLGSDGNNLYKLAYEKAKDIIRARGVPEEEIEGHIITDAPSKPVHRISKELHDERSIPVILSHREEPASLLDLSILLKSLRDNDIAIHRIYVSNEFKDEIRSSLGSYI